MPPKAMDRSRSSTSGVPRVSWSDVAIVAEAWLGDCCVSTNETSLLHTPTVKLIEEDGKDQHESDYHVPDGRIKVEQGHARLQRLHHQRPQHGPVDRADAAGQRGAPDHRGGDHIEFVEQSKVVRCSVEAR